MSKVCNKCNAQIDDSVAFCPHCGNSMNVGQNDGVKPDLGLGSFNSFVNQGMHSESSVVQSSNGVNIQNNVKPDLGLENFNPAVSQSV